MKATVLRSAEDEVPDGYRAMNDREAIKVMVKPS
jgi:threonine dehydrogenase-like Zn-dependent dehydrogenase